MKMDFERIMHLLNEMKHKPSFTLSFLHAIDKSSALVPTSLSSKNKSIGSNRVTIDDSSKKIDARNDEDIARRTKESSKYEVEKNDKLVSAITKRQESNIKPNKRKGVNQDESEHIESKKGIIANGSNTRIKQSQPTMSLWCNNLNLGFESNENINVNDENHNGEKKVNDEENGDNDMDSKKHIDHDSAAVSLTLRETYYQAKTEYDQICKRSIEFQSRKSLVESQLSYQMKQMEAQMTRQPLASAVHDAMKMSDSGFASGSQTTLTQLQRVAKSTVEHVATTMSHCIDVVVKKVATGYLTDSIVDQAKAGEEFPPLVLPASANPDHVIMNNGETFSTMKNRFEAEISSLKLQLDASEAARAEAWSRLNKAQFELKNLFLPKTPAAPVYTSQSKYSIEKVRAKMLVDGSVLPVGSPKRDKDGLYLRPAGRQRKGMDWDGVIGKWVPEGRMRC